MFWLYIKKSIIQFVSVLKGMAVTIKYLLIKPPITEKYPAVDNRAGELPARFRGQLALISERRADTQEMDCITCKMCEKVCPNRSIVIEMDPQKHADGKPIPKIFDWNYSTCIFCNLCVEACNWDALTFVTSFEGANDSRENLLWDKHILVQAYTNSKKWNHKRSVDEHWDESKRKAKLEEGRKLIADTAAKAKPAEPKVSP
jgi:NADH-quinone oxidoreductase subunit I